MKEFDLIVIGSGPAGYTSALEGAKQNLSTALIERDIGNIGGVCLNEGCIPLKGLLYHAHHGKDYSSTIEYINGKIDVLRTGLKSRIKNSGIQLINGSASFISENEIEVGDDRFRGKYFILATGSSPRRIFKNKNVSSPDVVFFMENLPGSLLIIGGGVIGTELASLYNILGISVDIVEISDSLLYGADAEAVRVLQREFKKKKIRIYTGSKIEKIDENMGVKINTGSEIISENYDMIIEATGRIPNTSNMGLDKAGVILNDRGFVKINSCMETSLKSVYAAGDCIDTPMLANIACMEAEAAVNSILTGNECSIDYKLVPELAFSSPQIGGIGNSEKTVKKMNINYRIYKYYFKALGKALVEGSEAGFLKLIADNDSNEIIGATIVGYELAELMNELSIIIGNRIRIDEVLASFHIHPSYSEIIVEALKHG